MITPTAISPGSICVSTVPAPRASRREWGEKSAGTSPSCVRVLDMMIVSNIVSSSANA